jgi:hypothetical protein
VHPFVTSLNIVGKFLLSLPAAAAVPSRRSKLSLEKPR